MKDKIEFSEFLEIEKKLEIKVGLIKEVQRMEGSDKMLKLSVDLGGDEFQTVMTNIGNRPGLSEEGEAEKMLEGLSLPFITNLKPAKMMGVESTAMIMIPTVNDELQMDDVIPGSNLL
jgi:methionine--tRNA ligase beta chain